jgi:hypothetical protein
MTFREKSAWITLIAIVLVFGGYWTILLTQRLPTTQAVELLAGLIVVKVVIIIIAHIAIAIWASPEPRDERDRLIELRSPRNAYYVLISGLVLMMGVALVGAPMLVVVNGLLAALVLAEVVRFASLIVSYRRGG